LASGNVSDLSDLNDARRPPFKLLRNFGSDRRDFRTKIQLWL
jgi:hypothetical protein